MRTSSLNNEIPALKSDHDEDRLVRYSQLISRHYAMLRQFATAATALLCLLPPLCGSFPMCTDGQTPLMEADDAFPCSRGCPKGFFCEYQPSQCHQKTEQALDELIPMPRDQYQDSRRNPVLGICCANRTELQLLYGSNDKQVDPIWKDDDSAEHKSPALAVEAYSLTQAPGDLFIHTRTIDDNESSETLARNQQKAKKSGNNPIHITVTENLPAADDPLADEVFVDSDKSLGPSIESKYIEEFFPRDDGLYAEVSAFNATEILNNEDYIDSNSTSPELRQASNSTLATIKALSAGRKQHAKKSNIKNSEEEVVVLSSESKDSKETHKNWERDDSAEKLTAPKGVFQVLSKKDDLSTDVASLELSNSADKSRAQGAVNVKITNTSGKQSAQGDRSKHDRESEESENKRLSCERQNYELTCNSGTVKTQPKIRWYLNDNGECEHYPWGYCPGNRVADSTTIRTKEECLRECLSYTPEEVDNAKAKLRDDIPSPTDIHFQEEPLEQLHNGDKIIGEKSPVTNPPVTAETQACETSTVKLRDEERGGADAKEENHIDGKNTSVGKNLDSAPFQESGTGEDQSNISDGENNESTENISPSKEGILCTATSYRYVCKSGLRTQFVYRWSKVDGKCLSFPYGYCVYEFNHPHPRTRQECEKYC